MNLAGRPRLRLQSHFLRNLLHQVPIAHILKRPYMPSAREPVQPIKGAHHQALRAGPKVRFYFNNLAIEEQFFLASHFRRDLDNLAWCQAIFINPVQTCVMEHQRSYIR